MTEKIPHAWYQTFVVICQILHKADLKGTDQNTKHNLWIHLDIYICDEDGYSMAH